MEERQCSICGRETERLTEFDGQLMCQSCLNELTTVCQDCGRRLYNDNTCGDENTILCENCYNNFYVHCSECDALIYNDDAYYELGSDEPLCSRCFDELEENPIKNYGYKPEPVFYGSGDFFMGVELEIDKGGEDDDNADKLLKLANVLEERIYIKHDGSINDGFEIVSHPMSLEYHLNKMNWEEIFKKAVDMEYRSHQTSTCGLHIHVNRDAFGEDSQMQEEVIARIVYFVENHWNELLKFSRRTEENMERWANRYGISNTAKDTYKNAKNKRLGRYVAVNLDNYSTIEFRLFRGTLCYKTFVAVLQLIYEICRFALQMNDKGIERLSWSDFVAKIPQDKKELIDYLKLKRLYVNEITEESEDI